MKRERIPTGSGPVPEPSPTAVCAQPTADRLSSQVGRAALRRAAAATARRLSGEYDLNTADGRRHFRESMVVAAGESDKISERVKRGKVRRARRGRRHGGGRGYYLPELQARRAAWSLRVRETGCAVYLEDGRPG